jgi:hypothetical protein
MSEQEAILTHHAMLVAWGQYAQVTGLVPERGATIAGDLVVCCKEQVLAEQTTINPREGNTFFTHLLHCL